jgi:hypothetical protein
MIVRSWMNHRPSPGESRAFSWKPQLVRHSGTGDFLYHLLIESNRVQERKEEVTADG